MLKDVISQGDFAFWPQLSLLVFFVTFSAILVWVTRKGSDSYYRYMADLTKDSATLKEQDHD